MIEIAPLSATAVATAMVPFAKRGELRNAHRAVPDNRASALQRIGKELLGLGPDVETHPAFGNLVARNLLIIAVGIVLVADAIVNRNQEFNPLGFGRRP